MNEGRFILIRGLAGAGKTTIGTLLFKKLRMRKSNIILLDGDDIRWIYDNADYTPEGRTKNRDSVRKWITTLLNQDIDIIHCSIVMDENEWLEWRINNLKNYYEIYVRVSMDILIREDKNNLYSRVIKGEISDVVGMDIPAEFPKNPDMIIDNDRSESVEDIVDRIIVALDKWTMGF